MHTRVHTDKNDPAKLVLTPLYLRVLSPLHVCMHAHIHVYTNQPANPSDYDPTLLEGAPGFDSPLCQSREI